MVPGEPQRVSGAAQIVSSGTLTWSVRPPNGVGLAPNSVEWAPNGVGCCPNSVGWDPNVVGWALNGVG